MTRIINFLGGPGSGKSTIAAETFGYLKRMNLNVELVREFAKDALWGGMEHFLAKSEYQIPLFAEQYKRTIDLVDKVDYIVTDSPLILSLAYTSTDPFNEVAVALRSLVKAVDKQFDNINFFLRRKKTYHQIGRVQNEVQAIRLDQEILELYEFMNKKACYYGYSNPAEIYQIVADPHANKTGGIDVNFIEKRLREDLTLAIGRNSQNI